MSVTIEDVARRAGVSRTVVSYVLNDGKRAVRCSDETRRRTLEAAQELGYRRNPHSFALRTGRTKTIGLYLGDARRVLSHPNGGLWFSVVHETAAELGYSVMLAPPAQVAMSDTRRMDALVVAGRTRGDAAALDRVAASLPTFCGPGTRPPVGALSAQPRDAVDEMDPIHRLGASYLYGLGHRRLLVTEVKGAVRPALPTFERVALEMAISPRLEAAQDAWDERAYENTLAAIRRGPLPTAVYAFDDDMALRVIETLCSLGLRIPGDVSVFSRETHRSEAGGHFITGIAPRFEERWAQLVRQFVEVLEGHREPQDIVVLPPRPELVERRSCAAPHASV